MIANDRGIVTVIGIGNRFRRDDAAGLEVARKVRERLDSRVRIVELEGEPIDVLDVWTSDDEVIVADAVADAARPADHDLADALDQAVLRTPLRARKPLRWGVFGLVQTVFALAAIIGLVWLVVVGVASWLQLPAVPTVDVGPFATPFLLLIGGLLGASAAVATARRRRRRARRRDEPEGLRAFEGAPCYREAVERDERS